MKEQISEEGNELYRIAIACGMDYRDAFDDVADSIGAAVKAMPSISPEAPEDSISRYWLTFFRTYSVKCQERWFLRCGKSKDYEAMEKLWLTSFEPVWIAGCNLAKQNQSQSLSKGFNDIYPRYSDKLNEDDEESLKRWADDLLAWLDEGIPKMIAEFKESQRNARLRTMEELKEYDGASFFGKLKRWMSSR